MTERFRNPVIKYTTDTIRTLPASKLYFYQNGTSTPKAVYADKNKVTSLGAEVTADSAGVFVPIFLDGTYRVTLKNAAGTTQTGWPVDNVGGEDTQGQYDDWSALQVYSPPDIVTGSNGLFYVAIPNASQNLNQEPSISPLFWTEIKLSDQWNPDSTYFDGESVYYLGDDYESSSNGNQGNTPSISSAFWVGKKTSYKWNSSKTYSSGEYAYEGELRYISKQGVNLNHQPSADTTETWWKPDWQAYSSLTTVRTMTGGGALTSYTAHDLTDSSTYTLPLASTVPAGGFVDCVKPEQYKGFQSVVSRSGSDNIRYNGGTDTSVRFNLNYRSGLRFKSNGVDEWSI